MDRRAFIASAGAGLAPTLAAVQPGPVKIGVNVATIAANQWSAIQLLDYLAKLNVQAAQFNSATLGGPASASEEALRKVRAYAGNLGIELMYIDGSVCPTSSDFHASRGTVEEQLFRSLNIARTLGAATMKISVGGGRERHGIEKHIESTARAMKPLRARIVDSGVRLAMENHAEFQARELKALVDEVGRDVMGVLLDSANPVMALEDPHLTLEVLGPYAAVCHLRDSAIWRVPEGVAVRWVSVGEGNVDIAGWIRKFVKMQPGVALTLEILVTPEPRIFRIFESEIWKDFPKTPASEFRRYLALAEKGTPVLATPAPPEKSAGQLQCEALEASLHYTREVLPTI